MPEESPELARPRVKSPRKSRATPKTVRASQGKLGASTAFRVLQAMCEARDLPAPIPEFRFHETRKWRFDYAWPERYVALEVEGGAWVGGRHTSGAGFCKDLEKYSEAAALGWRILRVQPKQLLSSYCLDLIDRCLSLPD